MLDHKNIGSEMKVIVFRLDSDEYGVDIAQVRSIERMQQITRIPRTPSFVKGVINLRGVVIPVIDLKERLELSAAEISDSTRIVIVALNGLEVGMIVDSANDVINVTEDAIEPAPDVVGDVQGEYLRGVAKLGERLLLLLNLDQVLSQKELSDLDDFEG